MDRIPLARSTDCVSKDKFWKAVLVYHDKPHVINRKVASVVQLYFYELKFSKHVTLSDVFTYHGILHEVQKLKNVSKETVQPPFIAEMIAPYDKNCSLLDSDVNHFTDTLSGVFVSVRILLARSQSCENYVEVVVFDKNNDRASFLGVSRNKSHNLVPPFEYHFERLKIGHVQFALNCIEDCDTASAEWLADVLFCKFLKWCEDDDEVRLSSLMLVDVEVYYALYKEMKEKYCKKMIEIWPERTDPKKFVHEDAAIASYLICLWKKHSCSDVNFVDLGCGNGLLVYMLNQEGFVGYGIDVRKRKIWDIYPEETTLIVKTIVPSSESLFPDANFLIGNHSDELTPWIPVIAFRSSPKTNFFALPCCPYDFNGKKYSRKNTSLSQYSEYLDYIKTISNLCRFDTSIDKLRIPSTKRTCLIGWRRTNEFETTNKILTEFICSHLKTKTNEITANDWVQNYEPRAQTERVRNCTQLNRDFLERIVKKIVEQLLQTQKYDESGWNSGGEMKLAELPKRLTADELKTLKNECGGLKTLLKNHRYVFEVSKESFRLRRPLSVAESRKYREKPCWFQLNHPDGCLFDDGSCGYKHV